MRDPTCSLRQNRSKSSRLSRAISWASHVYARSISLCGCSCAIGGLPVSPGAAARHRIVGGRADAAAAVSWRTRRYYHTSAGVSSIFPAILTCQSPALNASPVASAGTTKEAGPPARRHGYQRLAWIGYAVTPRWRRAPKPPDRFVIRQPGTPKRLTPCELVRFVLLHTAESRRSREPHRESHTHADPQAIHTFGDTPAHTRELR